MSTAIKSNLNISYLNFLIKGENKVALKTIPILKGIVISAVLFLVSIEVNAAKCVEIQTVIDSSSIMSNEEVGGHLAKHVYGQWSKTNPNGSQQYRSVEHYTAAWNAQKENSEAECPSSPHFGEKVESESPPAGVSEEYRKANNCASKIKENELYKCTSLGNEWGVARFIFVYKYENQKWILLTSYPKKN